jgi:hypothetical protein
MLLQQLNAVIDGDGQLCRLLLKKAFRVSRVSAAKSVGHRAGRHLHELNSEARVPSEDKAETCPTAIYGNNQTT